LRGLGRGRGPGRGAAHHVGGTVGCVGAVRGGREDDCVRASRRVSCFDTFYETTIRATPIEIHGALKTLSVRFSFTVYV